MQQDQPRTSSHPGTADEALPDEAPLRAAGEGSAGRYRIDQNTSGDERLGRDALLGRTVRVRTADAASADDLEREARLIASLDHTGIPAVHDLVRNDGGALLIMRHVQGIGLAAAIDDARGGLVRTELASPVAALRLIAKVCDALSAAHAQGVVHRAVRCDAISIGLHGQVVLGNWRGALQANERPATARYVASKPATQAHALDDLHTDIRGIGRCLFETLAWQPCPLAAGEATAALAQVDPQRMPAQAATIIRRAITSNLNTGYRTAAELGADLTRAASELECSLAIPFPGKARRSGIRPIIAAGLGLIIGGSAVAGFLVWRKADSRTPPWSAPLTSEAFANADWRDRWLPGGDDQWKTQHGRLVSTAPGGALLVYGQRLTPPVAIEYTGQILPGERPGDLSVWWSEREGVLENPAAFADGARTWQIQAGAHDNQFCAIFRNPGQQRMAYNPLQFVTGRDYRFRVEIDGEYMSMAIDGVEVLRYRDRFPTTSGYLALYGFYPGKAFDDVAVWQKHPSALVPATATGDALLQFGHFTDAAKAYAQVAESGNTASQQALFRKGLAERHAGRNDLSLETWSLLSDGDLRQAADALRLEDLFTTGQHDLFLERMLANWRRHPSGHDDLRQQWQLAMTRLLAAPAPDPILVERYLAARDQIFANDPISAYETTSALSFLQRYEEIVSSYPGERKAYAAALQSLGRLDEAARLPWLGRYERISINLIRGDYPAALRDVEPNTYHHAFVLCKLGRAAEVTDPSTRIHPAMLHLGRAEDLLASRPLSAGVAREGLLAAGRFDDAAGAGLADVAGSGGEWRAMVLLGRLDDAERAHGRALPWARLMPAWDAGDREAVARLRAHVGWPRDLATSTGWFAGLVIAPLVERLSGDRGALEASLRRATKEWDQVFGKRAWFLARAALGEATDAEVLDMPVRSEGQAWLQLAKALRAELADQPAEAISAYRAYTALPAPARLLDNNTLDPQVETFVHWRLRALGR